MEYADGFVMAPLRFFFRMGVPPAVKTVEARVLWFPDGAILGGAAGAAADAERTWKRRGCASACV